MRTQVNRFKHLPHWSCEIENKGKFRGSSYWHNTAAQQVWHPLCAQATHNSGVIQPAEVESFLTPLPVGCIPGVGKVTEAKLAKLGMRTVGELRSRTLEQLQSLFGRYGQRLYEPFLRIARALSIPTP